jgi:hypothetical protein
MTTRRVGPLRKPHLELLRQSRERAEAALAQVRQIDAAARAQALEAVALVVEDLGGTFNPGESVRPVPDGSDVYLEITETENKEAKSP